MLASNTILQERYRVIRQLGQGGMGTVYEALDQRVNAIVAIKETLVGRDEDARSAFKREAGLLANLRHQALPKVMDYFDEGDGEFLVMEYIQGYDLSELLDLRGTPFDVHQVLRWADELLKVLEYLHGSNPPVLHRDIKPSNLKLTKQGEIFLLDFGLAKGTAGQMPTLLTSHSVHGYTPIYAPLEQIHGKGTDPRSDLYSLGATLYHLFTCKPPVDAPTRFDAIEDESPDPLRPIEELNPSVPSSIASVIYQAMAVSRKQRPASATEMRKALRQAEDEVRRAAEDEERRKQDALEAERKEEERRRQAAQEAARIAKEEARKVAAEEARRLALEQDEKTRSIKKERERDDEATVQRAKEDKKRTDVASPKTIPAKTQRAKETPSAEAKAETNVKTWKAPAPEKIYSGPDEIPTPSPSSDEEPAPSDVDESEERTPVDEDKGEEPKPVDAGKGKEPVPVDVDDSKRRQLIILAAVAVLGAMIVGAVFIWLMQRGEAPPAQANVNRPQAGQQADKSQGNTAVPAGMVYVPGGEFMMGRNGADGGDEYERPAHKVAVNPFYMDVYEVTCEEYKKFLDAVPGQSAPRGWVNGNYPTGSARKPVTGVTWDDANAYAKWADKRLPTEEEWEFAARGTDGRRYPWGTQWKAGLANADKASKGLADVGSYKGASPFGAFDMVGNAWEWTATSMKAYPGGQLPERPDASARVLRGGSYLSNRTQATVTYRFGWRATEENSYEQTGFRCAKDVSTTPK